MGNTYNCQKQKKKNHRLTTISGFIDQNLDMDFQIEIKNFRAKNLQMVCFNNIDQ